MRKTVLLTAIAQSDLENLTDYLMENWGLNVCEQFITHFEKVCEKIGKSSDVYPIVYQHESIRKCVLTKHNTIYYRENSNHVEIITNFDSRQDPDKLTKLIYRV